MDKSKLPSVEPSAFCALMNEINNAMQGMYRKAFQDCKAPSLEDQKAFGLAVAKLNGLVTNLQLGAEAGEDADPFYYWTVLFGVHPMWVADGFNLDDLGALEMLGKRLGYASLDSELHAEVVAAPDPDAITAEQTGNTVNGRRPRLCRCGAHLAGDCPSCDHQEEADDL